ncbi:MAG TPA: hypothetical protein VJB15_01995 [Rhodothermia bacterium]|nr:hypothetical protein [Rhodothermia bacterium]
MSTALKSVLSFLACAVVIASGFVIGANDGVTPQGQQSSAIDDRRHFEFPTWFDGVVKLRTVLETDTDFQVQEHMNIQRPDGYDYGHGPMVHMTASVRDGALERLAMIQYSIGDDHLVQLRVDDYQNDFGNDVDPGLGGTWTWGTGHGREGVVERYYATHGAPGELYLNITATRGVVEYDVTVYAEGATYLRAVDLDGVALQVNPPGTSFGVSLLQSGTVTVAGPSLGYFRDPLEFLDEGDCSTPEGAGCTGADRSSMPGDWTITMNREFRADEGMWYLAAIYPA